MDLKKVERLMELMKSYNVNEIEIAEGEEKIRVKKAGTEFETVVNQSSVRATNADIQATNAAPAAKPQIQSTNDRKVVTSPFVGTFYRAPAPGADPFVSIGQHVKKGDVLCIVEAMKLMNEIEAESDGTVSEILVQNEQPVEFDECVSQRHIGQALGVRRMISIDTSILYAPFFRTAFNKTSRRG